MDACVESPAATAVLHFDPEWCTKFLELSGDKNHHIHSPERMGVVQGLAILTKMGTVVSERFPGYMVARMEDVLFRQPVRIGDTVWMEIFSIGDGRQALKLDVRFLLNDVETGHVLVTLMRVR